MVRRLLAFLCALCLICSCVMPARACYYSDGSKTQEEMDRDVAYWRQGRVPADNSKIHSGINKTIGQAACSHFAMSYALVKMGYFDPESGDTPIKHIELARRHNAFRDGGYYYEYAKAPDMYPGVEYCGVEWRMNNMNGPAGLAYVKGKMAEGYYVIACVKARYVPGILPEDKDHTLTNGHMIFFDGINEDGTTSIGDSAFNGTTWEEIYGRKDVITTWIYVELLKCDTAPFNERPSIYKENKLRGVSGSEYSEYQDVTKEYNITGMPAKSDLGKYIIPPSYPAFNNLMIDEIDSLVSIKESKEAGRITLFDIISAVSSIMGIAIIFYAVLLILGFSFDLVNSFFDIEVVSILTLGFIKVVRDPDDLESDKKKKGYVTVLKLCSIIFVVLLVGISLVSGVAVSFLYSIVGGF